MAAAASQLEHRLHVAGHAGEAPLLVPGRIARPQLRGRLERKGRRDVSIQWIVRGGLVRDQIRLHSPAHELRQDLSRVPHHSDRAPFAALHRPLRFAQRFVERRRERVQISLLHAPLRACPVDFDADEHGAAHRRRKRLRPAHSAEPGADHQPPGEIVRPEVLPPRRRERLVGALQDSLGADVDPRPGGHLAVHDQAGALELAELLPGGPFRDQVRVRDQHPGRVRMRAQHADGLPALHQQGLVVRQGPERRADPLEAGPVAGRLAAAAVDHQLFRLLRHLRVQIVLQHPERRFLHPAPARKGAPAGGTDRVGHARFYDTVDTFRGWKTGAGT